MLAEATMQLHVEAPDDQACTTLLATKDSLLVATHSDTTPPCHPKEEGAGRRATLCAVGGCLVAALVAVDTWSAGAFRGPGRHFLVGAIARGRGADLTLSAIGLSAKASGATASARRRRQPIPVKELAHRLLIISGSLRGRGENISGLLEGLAERGRSANATAASRASAAAGTALPRAASPGRRLRVGVPPVPQWLLRNARFQRMNPTWDTIGEDLEKGYCGLGALNVVYSLGIVGLSAEGMAKTCPQNSTEYDPLVCGAFTTNLLSELSWAAAAATTMPETCNPDHPKLRDADCAADSVGFAANVLELVTDGQSMKVNCIQAKDMPIEDGRRRLLAAGPEPAHRLPVTRTGGALEAMGLVGRRRRIASGGLRGQTTPGSSSSLKRLPVSSEESEAGEDEETEAGEDGGFTRAFDLAACVLDLENSLTSVVDAVFSVISAAEACREFEMHGGREDQESCAANIGSFLADLATVVSNSLTMAETCPVEKPLYKVPCAADSSDLFAVLGNWVVWGSSFRVDCLHHGKSDQT
uniref:Uncharacterized protein n=1 Tax=Alexandrium monilatum TaxID=311494 RepID=A0A7S4UN89_9DINO